MECDGAPEETDDLSLNSTVEKAYFLPWNSGQMFTHLRKIGLFG
jgi:hypothetical protein